jgi:phosphopantetheinyl transferase
MTRTFIPITLWPDYPEDFEHKKIALVLFTLPADTNRANARLLAREVLRKLISHLLNLRLSSIMLLEGPRGPKLEGMNHPVLISLSYAGDKVLIGLCREQAIGVDIVKIEDFPEIAGMSRLYLPKSKHLLKKTPEPLTSKFALAWAEMESCCKALGLPLAEIDEQREESYAKCKLASCTQIDGYRIAVAVTPSHTTPV